MKNIKEIALSVELMDKLSNLVGQSKNDDAIKMLRKKTGYRCFTVVYDNCWAGKYAPKGYGSMATMWANSTKKEELIFSYFLSNLAGRAKIYAW